MLDHNADWQAEIKRIIFTSTECLLSLHPPAHAIDTARHCISHASSRASAAAASQAFKTHLSWGSFEVGCESRLDRTQTASCSLLLYSLACPFLLPSCSVRPTSLVGCSSATTVRNFANWWQARGQRMMTLLDSVIRGRCIDAHG
jgi:hypothetical protein